MNDERWTTTVYTDVSLLIRAVKCWHWWLYIGFLWFVANKSRSRVHDGHVAYVATIQIHDAGLFVVSVAHFLSYRVGCTDGVAIDIQDMYEESESCTAIAAI